MGVLPRVGLTSQCRVTSTYVHTDMNAWIEGIPVFTTDVAWYPYGTVVLFLLMGSKLVYEGTDRFVLHTTYSLIV